MGSEYWQKIAQLRVARQEAEEKTDQQLLKEWKEKRDKVVEKMIEIFEDLRSNDPKIEKTPLNEVKFVAAGGYIGSCKKVVLRWGNKFQLSQEDRVKMKTTDIDMMVGEDYKSIVAEIGGSINFPHEGRPFFRDDPTVNWGHYANRHVVSMERFSLDQFLENPDIVLPTIERLLEKPTQHFDVWTKDKYPGMFRDTEQTTSSASI